MKAFGDGALSNFHFPKVPPPGGRPRRGTLSADAQQARLGLGGVSSTALSSSSIVADELAAHSSNGTSMVDGQQCQARSLVVD
jgi:hypothetical protein